MVTGRQCGPASRLGWLEDSGDRIGVSLDRVINPIKPAVSVPAGRRERARSYCACWISRLSALGRDSKLQRIRRAEAPFRAIFRNQEPCQCEMDIGQGEDLEPAARRRRSLEIAPLRTLIERRFSLNHGQSNDETVFRHLENLFDLPRTCLGVVQLHKCAGIEEIRGRHYTSRRSAMTVPDQDDLSCASISRTSACAGTGPEPASSPADDWRKSWSGNSSVGSGISPAPARSPMRGDPAARMKAEGIQSTPGLCACFSVFCLPSRWQSFSSAA